MLRVLAWHQMFAPNRFGSLNHARFGQRRDTSHWRIRRLSPGPTGIAAKAIGYANAGIARGRGIDRANRGFPLLQAQWAEDAPTRMFRGVSPRPPHPRYETADLAMIRQGI